MLQPAASFLPPTSPSSLLIPYFYVNHATNPAGLFCCFAVRRRAHFFILLSFVRKHRSPDGRKTSSSRITKNIYIFLAVVAQCTVIPLIGRTRTARKSHSFFLSFTLLVKLYSPKAALVDTVKQTCFQIIHVHRKRKCSNAAFKGIRIFWFFEPPPPGMGRLLMNGLY